MMSGLNIMPQYRKITMEDLSCLLYDIEGGGRIFEA